MPYIPELGNVENLWNLRHLITDAGPGEESPMIMLQYFCNIHVCKTGSGDIIKCDTRKWLLGNREFYVKRGIHGNLHLVAMSSTRMKELMQSMENILHANEHLTGLFYATVMIHPEYKGAPPPLPISAPPPIHLITFPPRERPLSASLPNTHANTPYDHPCKKT